MKEMNAACGVVALAEGRSVRRQIGGVNYSLHQADCLQWMDVQPANHVHAIVTDPPTDSRNTRTKKKRSCEADGAASGESRPHTMAASVIQFLALRS